MQVATDPIVRESGARQTASEATASSGTTNARSASSTPAATLSAFSFKLHEPGSQSLQSIGTCGWGEFDGMAQRRPFDRNLPLLVMLGQQKGGTTWFANALHRHPAIFPARGGRGCAALLHAFRGPLHRPPGDTSAAQRRSCTLSRA